MAVATQRTCRYTRSLLELVERRADVGGPTWADCAACGLEAPEAQGAIGHAGDCLVVLMPG